MDEKSLGEVRISGGPASAFRNQISRIERREWMLWSYAVLVMILLMVAIGSFAFPELLSALDEYESFFMNQAVRALAGLVLLFNVYVVYQQYQINKIRRQLTHQVFAVDKVEVLAQEVYKIAVLDSVTGLLNRRYIEQRLEEELARARRQKTSLTVILFDLDDFKQVNDTYGHAAGDRLLALFADRLKKATRGSDAVARYGGDEFLVVLPECRPADVRFVLKRLEGIQVELNGEAVPLAFSAGWADYAPGETATELLSRADAALYARKRGETPQPAGPRVSA